MCFWHSSAMHYRITNNDYMMRILTMEFFPSRNSTLDGDNLPSVYCTIWFYFSNMKWLLVSKYGTNSLMTISTLLTFIRVDVVTSPWKVDRFVDPSIMKECKHKRAKFLRNDKTTNDCEKLSSKESKTRSIPNFQHNNPIFNGGHSNCTTGRNEGEQSWA